MRAAIYFADEAGVRSGSHWQLGVFSKRRCPGCRHVSSTPDFTLIELSAVQ